MEAIEDKRTELKAKNDFRDKVAKAEISPEEEFHRGQNVHLLQLRTRKKMCDADTIHLEGAIRTMESAQHALGLIQDCEYKTGAVKGCQKQIDGLKQKLEDSGIGEINALTLAALEELQILRVNQETIED